MVRVVVRSGGALNLAQLFNRSRQNSDWGLKFSIAEHKGSDTLFAAILRLPQK